MPTLFFYDLETSGRDPKRHRIMQFAGRRTDMELRPIGEPINILVKLSPEVLPEPQATLITGLTPQQANEEGMSERDAIKLIMEEAFTPDTIIVGFNNVRFDDEFIRYTCYRNFYDAYEWHWQEGRSRWDLIDVVRLVRALRPEGIVWPVDDADDPINKLELIAAANGVEHLKAHDALSDVDATIAVAELIRTHQPRMFDYLLEGRGKFAVERVVGENQPFVYASSLYGRTHDFTTVAVKVGEGSNHRALVYDLRFDPTPFLDLTIDQLRERCFAKRIELEEKGWTRPPVKELTPNKCPAVAPWSTMTPEVAARLELPREMIKEHLERLHNSNLGTKLVEAYRTREPFSSGQSDVDGALYDGFVGPGDKGQMAKVRTASADQLTNLKPTFTDARLPELFLRYKARNIPASLSDEEQIRWQAYLAERLDEDRPDFESALAETHKLATDQDQPLLEALTAWERQSTSFTLH